MTLTFLSKTRRPKTSDEVLAQNMRDAVEVYNKAYKEAEAAGLNVGIRMNTASGYNSVYGNGLRVAYITRVNRREM